MTFEELKGEVLKFPHSVLFVTGGSEFWILDADTGETRRISQSRIDVLGPPRVTVDGTTIVYSRRVTEADVWLAALR